MKPLASKLLLLLGMAALLAAGCSSSSSKEGKPIQEGDYTTAPGGAAKTK